MSAVPLAPAHTMPRRNRYVDTTVEDDEGVDDSWNESSGQSFSSSTSLEVDWSDGSHSEPSTSENDEVGYRLPEGYADDYIF